MITAMRLATPTVILALCIASVLSIKHFHRQQIATLPSVAVADMVAPAGGLPQGLRACGDSDPFMPVMDAQARSVVHVYCSNRGQLVSGGPLSPWTPLREAVQSKAAVAAFIPAWSGTSTQNHRAAFTAIDTLQNLARLQPYVDHLFDAIGNDAVLRVSGVEDLKSRPLGARSMELVFHATGAPTQRAILLDFLNRKDGYFLAILCTPTCDYTRPLFVIPEPN